MGELFICVGCGELHSLSTLTQHAETKANGICKKNYEALGLWTILKQNRNSKSVDPNNKKSISSDTNQIQNTTEKESSDNEVENSEKNNSEEQKCVCNACYKCFTKLDDLRLHLNTVKKCRPKYDANEEIMQALKNEYKIKTGNELFNCVGCDQLHSLRTISKHIAIRKGKTKNFNGTCKEKYEAIGQWTILNEKMTKFKAKQKHVLRNSKNKQKNNSKNRKKY